MRESSQHLCSHAVLYRTHQAPRPRRCTADVHAHLHMQLCGLNGSSRHKSAGASVAVLTAAGRPLGATAAQLTIT